MTDISKVTLYSSQKHRRKFSDFFYINYLDRKKKICKVVRWVDSNNLNDKGNVKR